MSDPRALVCSSRDTWLGIALFLRRALRFSLEWWTPLLIGAMVVGMKMVGNGIYSVISFFFDCE
jgi:hypothetical protein